MGPSQERRQGQAVSELHQGQAVGKLLRAMF